MGTHVSISGTEAADRLEIRELHYDSEQWLKSIFLKYMHALSQLV